MAFQAIPDVASVKLIYNYAGGPDIDNTIYVRNVAAPWSEANLSGLGDTVQAWWEANLRALLVDDIVLTTIDLKDEENEFGQRVTKTVGLAGSVVTTPAPVTVAAIVKFTYDSGAPPRQGRIFHPGLTEAQITDQALDATFAGNLRTAYAALPTAITAAVAADAFVGVSRYSGSTLVDLPNGEKRFRPTKRATALTNTLSSVSVPTRFGVQKRRRPSPF